MTGVLNGIERELYKDFKDLRKINMVLSNFKEFFQTGNQWMNYLNLDVSNKGETVFEKSLRLEFQYISQYVSFDSIYEYPDEDLCLFCKQNAHALFIGCKENLISL